MDKINIEALKAKAESGQSKAQLILGMRYLSGDSLPLNFKEAGHWLLKAAEQREIGAMYHLGLILYKGGFGIDQDKPRALYLITKDAYMGFSPAQVWVGIMHLTGYAAHKDEVEAMAWFIIASSSNSNAVLNRDKLAEIMSLDAVDKANNRAKEILRLIEKHNARKSK